jgi:NAD(P)H-hydrate repair Nnr-like enzyme with NAD(P)H-hydrate dehydratase domain
MIEHTIEYWASRPAGENIVKLAAFNQGFTATPLIYATHKPGEIIRPFAELSPTQAQKLMDELWSVGVRPTTGKSSDGQLEAVQAHLKDMQKLVFDALAQA